MRLRRGFVAAIVVGLGAALAVGWTLARRSRDSAPTAPVPPPTSAPVPSADLEGAAGAGATLTAPTSAAGVEALGPRHAFVVIVEGRDGPLANASVTVEVNVRFDDDGPTLEAPAPPVRRTVPAPQTRTTDAQGRAAFVVHGDLSAAVTVAAEGHMPRSTTHWLDDERTATGPEEERVVLEPGAKIEGFVVAADGGAPVAGAAVRTGAASDDPDAVTDARGTFRFYVDRTTRDLRLRAEAKGFDEGDLSLTLWNGLLVDPLTVTLRLERSGPDVAPEPRGTTKAPTNAAPKVPARLEVGTLVVTVLDPDGAPTTEDVFFTADVDDVPGEAGPDPATAVNLRALFPRRPLDIVRVGTFRFTPVVPGTARVTASVDGFAPADGTVEVRAGRETTLTLRLGRGVTLRGTVVDPEGRPVPHAGVTARRRVARTVPHPKGEGTKRVELSLFGTYRECDEQGRFVLEGLVPGLQRLRAGRGRAGYTEYDGELEATAPGDGVRVVVRRIASVGGRVVLPDGTAFRGSVRVEDESGDASVTRPPETYDGTFEQVGVRDGEHEFVVEATGYPPLRLRVTVRDGASIDVGTLRLDEGRTFRGRAVDSAGRPVESVKVTLEKSEAVSREDGTFEFEHVASGPHPISLAREGFATTTVDVEASKDAAPVVVTISRGGVVRGTLAAAVEPRADGTLQFLRHGSRRTEGSDRVEATRRPDDRYFAVLAAGRWDAVWFPTSEGDEARIVLATVDVAEGEIQTLNLASPPR